MTEHTATSLSSRCQHRYGRWQHATGGSDLEHFLAEVTQTRSEDLERLCLVCRTPGHERPAAAQRLCYSCLAQAKGRGQSVAAYIAGDERLPPAAPRPTFGPCRMACDALACGGDGLCGEHLRHWRRAGRPAGAAFDAWRERVGEPLPGSRHVDLGVLSETLRWEFLLGLSVAIDVMTHMVGACGHHPRPPQTSDYDGDRGRGARAPVEPSVEPSLQPCGTVRRTVCAAAHPV